MITPDYSIVIPAYNESVRIVPTLDRVLAYIQQQGWEAEIVVVNDGSRDDTADIVRDYAGSNARVRLVENPGNCGKGYSVRNGILHAKGAVVLFTDADLSSPIEEAAKLLDSIHQGCDVAIGSRWLRSDLQTARQPIHRQVLGRAFNLALKGYKTKEIPVAWAHDERSKINPIIDGMSMLLDMFRVRWNSVLGKYDYSSLPALAPTAEAEEVPVGHHRA